MTNFYVYFHRDLETGNVFYVGIGDKRCSVFQYQRAFNLNPKDRNPIWHYKLLKCSKGVAIEIVEEFDTIEECKSREIYWVKRFGKLIDDTGTLTNITDGGDEVKQENKILQYDLNGNFLKEWSGVREACTHYKVSDKAIFNCLERPIRSRSCAGFMWAWSRGEIKQNVLPFIDKRKQKMRKVYQYDQDGTLIDKFNSISQAAKATKTDTSSIFKCLKGERRIANGYIWKS